MSGNTVTITAALADELRKVLLEARRMPAIAHDAVELAERLDIAVRLAAEARSRPTAQLIPLPSAPEPEAAKVIESHVARTMFDMPPPIAVSVICKGEEWKFDTWAVPREREVLMVSDSVSVRVLDTMRDIKHPNVLHVRATILYDDRGGPF